MNKNKNARNLFELLLSDKFREYCGGVISLAIILTSIYGTFSAIPKLQNYDLNRKLHVPQKEVIIRDPGVQHLIKREKEFTADFNRMYAELNCLEKIAWREQPLDSANIYPSANYPFLKLEESNPITMRQYYRYILEYRNKMYCHARQLANTKYKNYNSKQK